jgi:hypothetical protein
MKNKPNHLIALKLKNQSPKINFSLKIHKIKPPNTSTPNPNPKNTFSK